VALFFNGTWATSKDAPGPGFFASQAHKVMYNPENIITAMYKHCLCPKKYVFDGPGTDIFDDTSQAFTATNIARSLGGGVAGNVGRNGVTANLNLAIKILKEEYAKSQKPLDVYLFGWSRGAYTVHLLKKELEALELKGEIKINKIHIGNIDPVPGGPMDRVGLARANPGSKKFDQTKVTSTTYYSDTGNVNVWDSVLKGWVNTPFFSGLDDETPGATKLVMPGTHEELAGSHIEKSIGKKGVRESVGLMVRTSMVSSAMDNGLEFDATWRNKVIKAGCDTLPITEVVPTDFVCEAKNFSRKFLTTDSPLLPKSLAELKNFKTVSDDLAFNFFVAQKNEEAKLLSELLRKLPNENDFANMDMKNANASDVTEVKAMFEKFLIQLENAKKFAEQLSASITQGKRILLEKTNDIRDPRHKKIDQLSRDCEKELSKINNAMLSIQQKMENLSQRHISKPSGS
jgi:hypothetical protein